MQPLDDIAALAQAHATAAPRQSPGPSALDRRARRAPAAQASASDRSGPPAMGSPAASRSGRRSTTPSALPASRASDRSSRVQRSAVTSASSPRRTSSSDRGPSSRVTRSPARARKPDADIVPADDEVGTVVSRGPAQGYEYGDARCSSGRRRPSRAACRDRARPGPSAPA